MHLMKQKSVMDPALMDPSIIHLIQLPQGLRRWVLHNTDCTEHEDGAASKSTTSDAVNPNPKDICTNKNYCYVCNIPQTKIARHLKKHEKVEPAIAEAFMFPPHSRERKRLLEKLRNQGNYQHNGYGESEWTSESKKKTKQRKKTVTKLYVHCLYCKGMFVRKELWRHLRRCPSKPGTVTEASGQTKVLALADIAESTSSKAISPGFWKVLGNMKEDEIASVVRNDFLILQLGQSFYNKHGNDSTKYEYIRQKVREMGRLLLSLRKNNSIFSFEDAAIPNNFYKVIEAVRDGAGFDEEKHSYRTPSLALKLGAFSQENRGHYDLQGHCSRRWEDDQCSRKIPSSMFKIIYWACLPHCSCNSQQIKM